jgi:hypothetical protein
VPIVWLAWQTALSGGVLSGTNGSIAGADQFFYLDEIRQSAQHVLIADHFDLRLGHAVFLDPLVLLGGGVWLLGVPIQAVFWLLGLLAAPVLAAGAWLLVAPALRSVREQAVALALGLFYMSPLVPILAWTAAISPLHRFELGFPAGEAMPAWQLWGYPHAAIATGLLAAALAGVAAYASGRPLSRRLLVGISAAAALAAWLHPWQGAIFIVVAAAVAVERRSARIARWLLVPVLAALLPLIYEAILSSADAAWRVDSTQDAIGQGPAWTLLVALGPLALVAVAGIRRVTPGPLRTVLLAWPVAALAVYFATDQFPYHAFQGMSIPLAALAVAGWRRVPRGAWAGVGLVALTAALAGAYEITTFRDSLRTHVAPYRFVPAERAALSYLDHAPQRGGVLAGYYLGMAVPAFTGRRTWVGEWTWTPHFAARQARADQLFSGQLPPATAQRFVTSTGARFVLTDCSSRTVPVGQLLGPLVAARRTFGCATVYTLR